MSGKSLITTMNRYGKLVINSSAKPSALDELEATLEILKINYIQKTDDLANTVYNLEIDQGHVIDVCRAARATNVEWNLKLVKSYKDKDRL